MRTSIQRKKEKGNARKRDGTGRGEREGERGHGTKHRAKIQLRSNRSFRWSRLPTKFAIYDPGKPKRTSFHDVAGRYLPRQWYDRTSDARVVRRNDDGIGRGARFNEAERCCLLHTYVHIYVRTRVCIYMMRVHTYICMRDCQNEFTTPGTWRRDFEKFSRPPAALSRLPANPFPRSLIDPRDWMILCRWATEISIRYKFSLA